MKKSLLVLAVICLWASGVFGTQAAGAALKEAIITKTDGTREILTGEEEMRTRLKVEEAESRAEPKLGYEAILSLSTVFPKDASLVYVSLEVAGLVPGDDLEVYQNGQPVSGEVTAVNELTFRMTESGTVDVYKKSEKAVLEQGGENETEMETEPAAPATGEAPKLRILKLLTVLFGFAVIFSAYMSKKQIK